MLNIRQKGDFSRSIKYLRTLKHAIRISDFEKYGQEGVDALSSATPVDTGETSKSWHYRIKQKHGSVRISFYNSNIQKGVPIAIILQYGHATKNGGWVQGRDYINPAIQPIFDKIANHAWREVTKL